MIETARVATPAGPLTLVWEPPGTVVAAGFVADPATLLARLPAALASRPPAPAPLPASIADPLANWLAGDPDALAGVPARQQGTPLQQAVWAALAAIPAGATATYGEIAASVGAARAARAVGSACGRNLLAPFVPCHRAVASGGGLGGYAYGLDVKRWLLRHESGSAAAYGVETVVPQALFR